MRSLVIFLMVFTSISHAFAEDIHLDNATAETIELTESGELGANAKVSTADIKNYLSTINPDSTCIDEYLHRRRQVIIKLAFTPVEMALGVVGGAYVGGVTGVLISSVSTNPWAELAYAVSGMMIGGAASVVVSGASATMAAIEIYDLDLMMKTLAELHLDRTGVKSEKLYTKYMKSSESPLSKEEFFAKLLADDESGALCSGEMIKQPKIKIGTKLKFKVARSKDFFKSLLK